MPALLRGYFTPSFADIYARHLSVENMTVKTRASASFTGVQIEWPIYPAVRALRPRLPLSLIRIILKKCCFHQQL